MEIDFIIETESGTIYADCTNQNVSGTAEDKLPQKVRKYWRKYGYEEVYIIRGNWIISEEVRKTLEEDRIQYGYKTNIITFEWFCNMLDGKSSTKNLEKFFV